MKRLIALVLFVVAFGVVAAPALAASGGSITVNQTDVHVGDTVTFTSTFSGPESGVLIAIMCEAPDAGTVGSVLVSSGYMTPTQAATSGYTVSWSPAVTATCYGVLSKKNTQTIAELTPFVVTP